MSADETGAGEGLERLEQLEEGSGGPEAEQSARTEDPASFLVHRFMEQRRAQAGADRVWQRLQESRRKAPAPEALPPTAPWMRAPRPAAFFAAAAMLVLLVFIGRGRGRPGFELELATTGQASVERAAANRGAGLAAGDRIRVAAGASAQLAAGSLVRVTLKEESDLGVASLAGEASGPPTTLSLSQYAGRAIYTVEPGAGLSVSIITPHATVRVIGTRFRVDVAAARTQVDVAEGTVEVSPFDASGTAAPRTVRVESGRSLAARAGEALGEPTTFNRIIDTDLGSGAKPIIGHGR